MTSSAIPDNQLREIRAAIGWANPEHRVRDVKNLLDNADMNGYKRGFKEAEAYTAKQVKEALKRAGVIVLSEEGSKNFREIMSRGEQEGEG